MIALSSWPDIDTLISQNSISINISQYNSVTANFTQV